MCVARLTSTFRGLLAGLLVLSALVAFPGQGAAKVPVWAGTVQLSRALIGTVAAVAPAPDVRHVVSADDGTRRPCDRSGVTPGTGQCMVIQCLSICAGLPTGAVTLPPPPASIDEHAAVTDDPSRGISTIPDLPPPRRTA